MKLFYYQIIHGIQNFFIIAIIKDRRVIMTYYYETRR